MGFLANALANYTPRPKAKPASGALVPASPQSRTLREAVASMTDLEWGRAVSLIKARVTQQMRHQFRAKNEVWEGIEQRHIGVHLRWSPVDRERIMAACEGGDFYPLALFADAMRANGPVYGAMRARGAVLRLPIQWKGDPFLVEWLRGKDPEFDQRTGALISPGYRSDYQRLFPLSELGAVHWDGDLMGLGIGEFIPDRGGRKRLRHLDLHWVRFDWSTHELTYSSPWETYVIRPGDGRWFVYAPYGLGRWWSRAPWLACALPVISMETAVLDRGRWQMTLADALKTITISKDRWDQDYADLEAFARDDWNRAAHLILQEGEKAELVESTGRGYEVYDSAEKSAADKIALTLRGQIATSGGAPSGLANTGSVWENVEQSIVAESAKQLAEAQQEQGLGPYAREHMRQPLVWMDYDCRTPAQKVADAEALGKHAAGLKAFNEAISGDGKKVDLEAYIEEAGVNVTLVDLPPNDTSATDLPLAPTSLDAVVKADEARVNKGLPPVGGEQGGKTLAQLRSELAPGAAVASADPDEITVHEVRYVHGLRVVIDRPAGFIQTGVGPDGPWTREYLVPYGEFEGTVGADGEPVDVFLGPAQDAADAFVIEQRRPDGSFDEIKVMLDFLNREVAIGMFLLHGPAWRLGEVYTVPVDELEAWLTRSAGGS